MLQAQQSWKSNVNQKCSKELPQSRKGRESEQCIAGWKIQVLDKCFDWVQALVNLMDWDLVRADYS